MTFSKIFNNNKFTLYIIIAFLGIYVHTYFIPLGRIGLKFFYFILLVHLLEFFLKTKRIRLNLNLFDYFLIATLFYALIQFLFTYSIESHTISLIYLINILLVSRFVISKYESFVLHSNQVYFVHLIIFTIGVILFFYAIFFIGLDDILLNSMDILERREMANKLTTTVMYTGTLPRYTGYYVDPNYWALHLTFAMYLLVSIQINSKNKSMIFILSISMIVFSIVLTQSRGAFLALLLAYLIYILLGLIFRTLTGKDIKVFIIFILLIVFIITIILSLDGIYGIDFEYMIGRYDLANLTNENSRTLGWTNYINYISNGDYLYHGYGLSSTVYYFSHHSSHNIYIYLLYNFGLVWLSLFLSFIILTLILLIKKIILVNRERKKLYIISIAFFSGILAQAFFIDVIFTIPFWANFMLTYKLLNLKRTTA